MPGAENICFLASVEFEVNFSSGCVECIQKPFRWEELGEFSRDFDTVCKFHRVTHYQSFSEITFNTFYRRVCGSFHCIKLQVFQAISVVSTNRLILFQKLIDFRVHLLEGLFDFFQLLVVNIPSSSISIILLADIVHRVDKVLGSNCRARVLQMLQY